MSSPAGLVGAEDGSLPRCGPYGASAGTFNRRTGDCINYISLLGPACGSGGMFVSASDYVREHGGNPAEAITCYGQGKVEHNAKLCLMNMAAHGMNGRILSGDAANTFYHDARSLDGFVVARDALAAHIERREDGAKSAVDATKPCERKRLRAELDEEPSELSEALTVIDEALGPRTSSAWENTRMSRVFARSQRSRRLRRRTGA